MNSIKQILDIGLRDEFTSIQKIRQYYLNLVNFLMFFFCSALWVVYFIKSEEAKLISLSLGIILSIFSIFLSIKKRNSESTFVTLLVGNSILFVPIYFKMFEPIEIFPHTIYFISSSLFLIRENKRRMIYIGVCAILFLILMNKYNYEPSQGIPTFVAIIFGILSHNYFLIFVEKQDQILNEKVIELNRSNSKNEELNLSLKLKNEELVGYTHAMNHDLKAPIRNIIAFTDLIEKRNAFSDEKSEQYFSFVRDSAQTMNTLIHELLTYSQVSNKEIQLKNVSLKVIIEQVINEFKYDLDNRNVEIIIGELPNINGNAQLLKSLFQNIISNSIKYQPKNNVNHQPTIKINAETDNKRIYVYISDNGIGIKKENIKHLFEPFKRFHSSNEYEGTGLGMSICLRVMERHNGKIELYETSKQGTTFKLSFIEPTNQKISDC